MFTVSVKTDIVAIDPYDNSKSLRINDEYPDFESQGEKIFLYK